MDQFITLASIILFPLLLCVRVQRKSIDSAKALKWIIGVGVFLVIGQWLVGRAPFGAFFAIDLFLLLCISMEQPSRLHSQAEIQASRTRRNSLTNRLFNIDQPFRNNPTRVASSYEWDPIERPEHKDK